MAVTNNAQVPNGPVGAQLTLGKRVQVLRKMQRLAKDVIHCLATEVLKTQVAPDFDFKCPIAYHGQVEFTRRVNFLQEIVDRGADVLARALKYIKSKDQLINTDMGQSLLYFNAKAVKGLAHTYHFMWSKYEDDESS